MRSTGPIGGFKNVLDVVFVKNCEVSLLRGASFVKTGGFALFAYFAALLCGLSTATVSEAARSRRRELTARMIA